MADAVNNTWLFLLLCMATIMSIFVFTAYSDATWHFFKPNNTTDHHQNMSSGSTQDTRFTNANTIVLLSEHKDDLPMVSLSGGIDEAIDNLRQISLPELSNYRSQCWFEGIPDSSQMYRVQKQMFKDQAKRSYDEMRTILDARLKSGESWRLRCLPLLYVLGVAKCGTTDIFGQFNRHPHFTGGATKEPMYWNVMKWTVKERFADYLDLFDKAAEIIENTLETTSVNNHTRPYHPVITGDFSVSTLFKYLGYWGMKGRSSVDDSRGILHADLIKHVTPKAKIIVIIRNPTERLWSEYLFFNKKEKTSAEEFHDIAKREVSKITSCLARTPTTDHRDCYYRREFAGARKWVRVIAGLYYPFIKDWLEVFPDMRIIRTEDYHVNRTNIMKDLFSFVGLDPQLYGGKNESSITNKGPDRKFAMYEQTRTMLDNFYHPYNVKLAELLKDKRFLFHT